MGARGKRRQAESSGGGPPPPGKTPSEVSTYSPHQDARGPGRQEPPPAFLMRRESARLAPELAQARGVRGRAGPSRREVAFFPGPQSPTTAPVRDPQQEDCRKVEHQTVSDGRKFPANSPAGRAQWRRSPHGEVRQRSGPDYNSQTPPRRGAPRRSQAAAILSGQLWAAGEARKRALTHVPPRPSRARGDRRPGRKAPTPGWAVAQAGRQRCPAGRVSTRGAKSKLDKEKQRGRRLPEVLSGLEIDGGRRNYL